MAYRSADRPPTSKTFAATTTSRSSTAPVDEIRYIVFNFDTMPFGAKTADADPGQGTRRPSGDRELVDRQALSTRCYKGTFVPLYSYVPEGVTGADPLLRVDLRRRRRRSRRRQGRRDPRGRRRHDARSR